MDEFEYYSVDQREDMELQDWEDSERSDDELIGDLAAIRALSECDMDPQLDTDARAIREKIERRGLSVEEDREFEEGYGG
jgi:hypothetical protein